MPITWWLLVRQKPTGEALGIAEYVEPKNYGPGTIYISKTDHWISTMHERLTEQLGPVWTYSIISRAEYETYRDLHGLRVLGE